MNKSPLIVVLAMVPALASGQDAGSYRCTMGDLTRRVEVLHETGVSVPCEVHYYKDSEMPGERQVLWSAQNEVGYCEAQASGFVEKLESMGWACEASEGVSAAPPSSPVPQPEPEPELDDTDVLAPADEDIEIPESDTPQAE